MKVILLSDVKNVGKKGDVKEVADGYGRNFLIKNKLAVEASKRSMEILDYQKAEEKAEYARKKEEAISLKTKIETLSLTIQVKAGTDGKIFGSVNPGKICEVLSKEYGIEIDKRKFVDSGNITALGHYDIKAELFKDVVATIKIDINSQ